MASTDADEIARAVLAAWERQRQIAPFSDADPAFDLEVAYAAARRVRETRVDRGERPIGRKIGFTNRTIWAEYGVYAPIWGPVYQSTVFSIDDLPDGFALTGLLEPRIEPEIVFRLARAPQAGMDDAQLLSCVEWVAHGFEIVQSVFPGWRFRAADTVAAFALHGALLVGPPREIGAAERATWLDALSRFGITLDVDGVTADRGLAGNVLGGGPLAALAHLVSLLDRGAESERLVAGEIVTTGTLTRALPIAPGERWGTDLDGIALDGISVAFR